MDWPWIKNLISAVVLLLTGSAITLISNWIKSKEDRKRFDLERQDKYRLAAIEKRIEVHQKAFEYWTKLMPLAKQKTDEKNLLIKEAWTFWSKNCLYMEERTRKGFDDFLFGVDTYLSTWDYAHSGIKDENEKRQAEKEHKDLWRQIHGFGGVISTDLSLDPIDSKMRMQQEEGTKQI